MKDLDTLVIGDDMRNAVAGLVDRLGPVQVVAPARWKHVVDQCGLAESMDHDTALGTNVTPRTTVLVGPSAAVLKHAAVAETGFGFVTPVAQTSKSWQRGVTWRDDTTLDLWRAGWSPQAVDRLRVATQNAVVEFVIGDVCRIPSVAAQSSDKA